MFKKRNEQGYAMLIVLFLVTFIMIASATFVSASVSNAKQERTVDNNNMAVVAAEMGIDYYKTALINELNTNKAALIEFAEDEIKLLVKEMKEKNLSKLQVQVKLKDIQNKLAIELKSKLKNRLKVELEGEMVGPIQVLNRKVYLNKDKTILFDGSSLFESTSIKLDNDGKSVVVKGPIFGHNGERGHDLGFEIEFILPDIIALDIDVETSSDPEDFNANFFIPEEIKGIEKTCPKGDKKNDKVDLKGKVCRGESDGSSPNFNDLDNTTVYYPAGYDGKNSNNAKFNGTKIYSDGKIDVKNMNSISKVYMNINGDLEAKNLNGISESTIIVGKSMVGDQVKVERSKLAIKGNLTVSDHLTVEKNSRICVGGKLTVKKQLKINNNSVYVYAGANKDIVDKIGYSKVIHVEKLADLWGMCGFGSENTYYPSVDDDWLDPIIDVEY